MKISIFFTVLMSTLVAVSEAIKAADVSKIRAKSKKSVIALKNSNVDKLLNGPRDFSIAVLLTATSSQIGCVLCTQFDPDYMTVADSWVKAHPNDDKLYFAKADFADSLRKVFEKFSLTNVPKLYLFKPTNDSVPLNQGFEEFSFYEGDNVQYLSDFIADHTGHQVKVVIPVRYDNMIFSFVVLAGLIVAGIKFQHALVKVLTSKQLWGAGVILSILLFISGYMFNSIRGTPYIGGSQDGRPQYFMDGQQNQFAIETNIMSTLYGVLAVLTIALIRKVPEIDNARANAIGVLVFGFLIFFGYSVLFDIFAKKSWGYPFRLLKLFSF